MNVGLALNSAAPGERVTVNIGDRTEQFIAANEIIGGEVWVSGDMVWSSTPSSIVLQQTEAYQSTPEAEEDAESVILPFQVLFDIPPQIGGDRPQLRITNYELEIPIGGINNLGGLEYLAAWMESAIALDDNGAISLAAIPSTRQASDYRWLGFGKLTTGLLRPLPQPNSNTNETGFPIPQDTIANDISELNSFTRPSEAEHSLAPCYLPPQPRRITDYLIFNERGYFLRSGTYSATQFEEDYSFQDLQNWDYRNTLFGNTNTPTPSVFDLNTLCNFTTSGASEQRDYNRRTSMTYQQQLTRTNNIDNQIYWNNQLFEGDRAENYSSNYLLNRTDSLFTSLANFFCANQSNTGRPEFDFYAWEARNTFSSWSGEITTIAHNIDHDVSESFDRPFVGNTLPHSLSFREVTAENTVYAVPSESWSTVTGFQSGFTFPVDGTETYTLTRTIEESISAPEPLLLSGEGTEGIYKQLDSAIDRDVTFNREAAITRFLWNNTHGARNFSQYERVEVVEKSEAKSLVYRLNNSEIAIAVSASFLFKIDLGAPPVITDSMSLANADNSPFFSRVVEYATRYKKTETLVDTFYSEQVFQTVPIWDILSDRSVYLLVDGFRYPATILTYLSLEEQVEAEIVRDIIKVILAVDTSSAIAYPKGLVGNSEVWIYPQDNCSALLQDILEGENRNYCNLADGVVYFAKSVESQLDRTTQQAEVYRIVRNAIVQDLPVSGAFIPITGASNVLGVSYHPQI